MNNLNKFTKDELIKKLEKSQLDLKKSNENLKTEVKSSENSIKSSENSIKSNENNIKTEENQKDHNGIWSLVKQIYHRILILFFSLTIIAIIGKIFKQYKTVKVFLKLANYIILWMFGVSMFQAFGMDWLLKLKYLWIGVLAFVEDSAFYKFLNKMFSNLTIDKEAEIESLRKEYNRKVEINDWKEKLAEADRQKQWEEWVEKHSHHKEKEKDEKSYYKMILLILLSLGGTLGIWYYGKDVLDILAPIMSIGELIKTVMRGGPKPKDPKGKGRIFSGTETKYNVQGELEEDIDFGDNEAFMAYATDIINRKEPVESLDQTPKASTSDLPPAPPAPPIPPTMKGEPESSKPSSLLDSIREGKKLKSKDESYVPNTSENKLEESLVKKSLRMKKAAEKSLTSALSQKLDSMRSVMGDDEENSSDEKENEQILKKGKEKFLSAIAIDESPKTDVKKSSEFFRDYPPALRPVMEKFPNLSKETLDKLSTPEGIRNRKAIIASLPDSELEQNPFSSNKSHYNTEKFDKLIKENLNLNSIDLMSKIKKEIPEYNIDNYRNDFMKAIESDINSGKSIEEKNQIKKEFVETDLKELESIASSSKITDIKNVINENYTHNSLLKEVKSKVSHKQLNDLIELEPDKLIDLFDSKKISRNDEMMNDILIKNIDNSMENLILKNPGRSKQELVEKLIEENPLHKNEILEIVSKTVDLQKKYCWSKYFKYSRHSRKRKC